MPDVPQVRHQAGADQAGRAGDHHAHGQIVANHRERRDPKSRRVG
jgi:hypothetical protein